MQTRIPFLRSKGAAVALLFCMSAQVLATSGSVVANVTRVLIASDISFGGCMAQLSVSPQTVLPGCQSSWVTFSCSGDFTDEVRAYRMVDVAELALATGKRVSVFFRDDQKHNGYCFAYRIDVLQ